LNLTLYVRPFDPYLSVVAMCESLKGNHKCFLVKILQSVTLFADFSVSYIR